jgi:hypothetical protein
VLILWYNKILYIKLKSKINIKRINRTISYFSIQKKLFFGFCILLFILFFAPTITSAATIYVNSSTGNDTTGDGSSGTPYKTFHKGYTSASSSDTIDLTGTFTWTDSDETGDVAKTGYTIAKNLTIQGQSADATIIQAASSANTATSGVFVISASYTVTMNDLTVRYGYKRTGSNGGGINNEGTLTVNRCSISYNHVWHYPSWGGYGGGIRNIGTLTVNDSNIDNNYAYSQGGGIVSAYVAAGTNTTYVTNTTVAYNSTSATVATVGGAGIFMRSGTVYVTNSTIAYNDAPSGTGDTTGISMVSGTTLHIKNSIVAKNEVDGNNVNYASGNFFDIYNSGTLNDNGGNIFGKAYNFTFSGTSWYDVSGNGSGDSVFTLYDTATTGSLNLDTSLAANSTLNGSQTLAITDSGSIAVDNGGTGTNNSVSVPSADQRGATRSSTDIGAYEYVENFGVPTVSTLAPADNATAVASTTSPVITFSEAVDAETGNITIYNASDDSIVETIDVTSAQVTGSGTTAITINPASNLVSETGYYIFVDSTAFDDADSKSYAGISASSTWSFTTSDSVIPSFSSISSSVSNTGSTITWTTSEASSSRLEFGLTMSYGTLSDEENTDTRVTSHSLDLSNLYSCATFHYRTRSTDDSSNEALGDDSTLTTSGCTGNATVLKEAAGSAATTTASTVVLAEGTSNLSLLVPAGYSSDAAEFQLKQLTASEVIASATAPSGRSIVGNHTYSMLALTGNNAATTSFDEPLSVTISYTDAEIAGLNESTLGIQRWDNSDWNALASCSVNTSANTITCTTTSFSTFGLFGEDEVAATSSSGSVILPPPATGSGAGTVRVGIGQTTSVGEINEEGTNFLSYIDSEVHFIAQTSSSNNSKEKHSFKIVDLDIVKELIVVIFRSKLVAIELLLKGVEQVDLDGDGVNDLKVTFADLLVNRIELTLEAIAGSAQDTPPPDSTTAQETDRAIVQDAIEVAEEQLIQNEQSPVIKDAIFELNEDDTQEIVTPFTFTKFLTEGHAGVEVKNLQQVLKDLGYYTYPATTGIFGPVTKDAVIAYQRVKNITPSAGYVGPSTRKSLNVDTGNSVSRNQKIAAIIRSQGIGMSNVNLKKIALGFSPVFFGDIDHDELSDAFEDAIGTNKEDDDTDKDGYKDKWELQHEYPPDSIISAKLPLDADFANRYSGKILLQAESRGEAWYVHPRDNRRYFLNEWIGGSRILQELGLAIVNNKIEENR